MGRGLNMEIGSYIERFINDELIANIIDLCPVGALTSMSYAFNFRPWEVNKYKTIDILDSLASSIRLDVIDNNIMRVVPCLDEITNEEWITNKTRFSFDSLNIQRLQYPKYSLFRKFFTISWKNAINIYLKYLNIFKFKYIQLICGPFVELELVISLKGFFNSIGCSNLNYFENNSRNNFDFRCLFFLNKTLLDLENLYTIILFGSNLRMELPLLNSRLRKNYLYNNLNIYSFGLSLNYLTFPVKNLGIALNLLLNFSKLKNLIIF
jgi:NADH dehydrogenase/NADH:ubiquinone oxidoreductase subunit G